MFSYVAPEKTCAEASSAASDQVNGEEDVGRLGGNFPELDSHTALPSIPPAYLVPALLRQTLCIVRSSSTRKRLPLEQVGSNRAFEWFVAMGMDDPIGDATVFCKHRNRLFKGNITHAFFGAVLTQARTAKPLTHEPFPLAGTLAQAWAR